MKNLWLIIDKELMQVWSRKTLFSFFIFFIIYVGYLNFLSLNIYSNMSFNIQHSPQLILSADPNQGIVSPLFSNLFLLFLLVFPFIMSNSISNEKENETWNILKLHFSLPKIVFGKFISFLLLSCVMFFLTFLLLLPYILSKGFLDITYLAHLFLGFFIISLLWISLSLFISSITQSQTAFFIVFLFNVFLLGLSFIADIVNFPFLLSFNKIIPYVFYNELLSGILDIKIYLFYCITSLFFLFLTILNKSKIILLFLCYIILILLSSTIHLQYDTTFNKRNSLSSDSITVLQKIKKTSVDVNLYIREREAKWQTANDLIKLYQLNFRNIHFHFLNPERYNKEYGSIEFITKTHKISTLSIDEDIFTDNMYYVATGQKISITAKKEEKGYPFQFTKTIKKFYFFWLFILFFLIFYYRHQFLKKGAKL